MMPTTTRLAIGLLVLILAGLLLSPFCHRARAEGTGPYSEWFRSLRQPVTGMSCCDVSDCTRTKAEWRNGQWWAVVAGKWTPIPPAVVLAKPSILEDAVVCNSPPIFVEGGASVSPRIYCFAPMPMSF